MSIDRRVAWLALAGAVGLALLSCRAERAEEPASHPMRGTEPLAFDAHVAALAARLPAGFHVVVEPPFVVVGDEPAELVERRARRTVRWAVRALKRAYFARDPDEILDIWLFKDRDSYMTYVEQLFGERPDTPFGYYAPGWHALVMNIATGGGTLVHEIVHPFVRANFPACPAWFNEGLGSLYEQCDERDGAIVGLTNWRLAGLQEAIRAKRLPPFRAVIGTTEREFYHDDPGTHYAQVRYLCYYLQEHGLLRRFYRAFETARHDDPSGLRTLCRVLGQPDLTAFQRHWESWVLALHYP